MSAMRDALADLDAVAAYLKRVERVRCDLLNMLDAQAAEYDARVTKLLLANNREVERRRAAETPSRPMSDAPRDGRMIRLRMGADQDVTVGWWRDDLEITGPRRPWWFIDHQTNPASHFINRCVEHLPVAWGPI